MKKTMVSMLVVLAVTNACGGPQTSLFDVRMLIVPSPGQTRVQALCVEGTDAQARAEQLVVDLNASVEGDRALLEAIATAEGRAQGPITTYEVTVDGRTMVVDAVTNGEGETFTGKIDGKDVLQGSTTDEGRRGTISYEALQVSWQTEEDGTVRVARTEQRAVSLVLTEARVAIVVDATTAAWNTDSGVFMEGDDVLCWSGEERCDVTCTPDQLQSLTADVIAVLPLE